jgi:hypothetical protein
MNKSHIELVRQAIPLWHAQMAWAKELIVRTFNLERAEDILNRENRGIFQVPATSWFIRTHGIGVDIFKTPNVGGIDFDFDKPNPDTWRLVIFIERQVNDGQLKYELYRELIDDEELMKKAVSEALNAA